MNKSYKDITNRISKNLGSFTKESKDVMQSFHSLASSATKTNALDEKTKELIALAIGVAKRCDGCIGFHTKKLISLNVSKEEFIETLNVAVYMGGGPSLMYAGDAVDAFDEFSK